MTDMMRFLGRMKGSLMLLLAAAIWGFAFTAQTAASDSVPPFAFTGIRSMIGVAVLTVYLAISRKGEILPSAPAERKELLKGGTLCGVALFAAVNFQQCGLTAYPDGVAAAGRGSFLTALYVIMVPICGLFFRRRVHPAVWIAVAVSLFGMDLLCFKGGFSGIYWGDVLMLGCAVTFTGHIFIIDHFTKRVDGVRLSCMQFFVCGVLSLITMVLFETPDWGAVRDAWLPLMYAGVMSSGIAYTLQIVGQRYTDPALAPLVMSLESVFGVLGGWLFLQEKLSARELGGCALVFAAVILAQVPDVLVAVRAKKEAAQ